MENLIEIGLQSPIMGRAHGKYFAISLAVTTGNSKPAMNLITHAGHNGSHPVSKRIRTGTWKNHERRYIWYEYPFIKFGSSPKKLV